MRELTQSEMAAVSGGDGELIPPLAPINIYQISLVGAQDVGTQEITVVAKPLDEPGFDDPFVDLTPTISYIADQFAQLDALRVSDPPPGPDCSGHPIAQTDPLHGNDHDHLPPNIDEIRDLVRLFDQLYGGVVQTSADEIGALIYLPPGGDHLLLGRASSDLGIDLNTQYNDLLPLVQNIPVGSTIFATIHSHPSSDENRASVYEGRDGEDPNNNDLAGQADSAGHTFTVGGFGPISFAKELILYVASPGNATVEYTVDDARLNQPYTGQIVAGTNGSGGPVAMCGAG